jgi:uncharacterized membrane protein
MNKEENKNLSNSGDNAKLLVPTIKNYKAEIIEIRDSTTTEKFNDNYIVKVLEGDIQGRIIDTYGNGFNYKVGDKVFIESIKETDGSQYYNLGEAIRYNNLIITCILFVGVIAIIFGKKGLKALISLTVSLGIIFFVLLPLTLKGYNPVFIASGIAIALLFSVMLITHGRNKVTYSALLGCSIAIFVTIIISYVTILDAKITGFVDETSYYLFFNTSGIINFQLLVIASIIIGVIGVVDDGAITQAGIVAELKKANKNLSSKEYYTRAMRVGSDHAGAMINTLVLAYVGSALPLLLLIYTSNINMLYLLNKEIIATEIFRSLIGSIGLLLAIPLTTLFAVKLIKHDDKELDMHVCSHGHNHN